MAAMQPEAEVTPVAKVISLLKSLLQKAEDEAKSEAENYEEFACFCKDMTEKKSDSIKDGIQSIDVLSSRIEKSAAGKTSKGTEVVETKAKNEKLKKSLGDTENEWDADHASYLVNEADLAKAISSLENAKKSLESAKTESAKTESASFLELADTLKLADAMGMVKRRHRKYVAALLQQKISVDPNNPTYGFHSDGIIDVIQNLYADFTSKKASLDKDWAEQEKGYKEITKQMEAEINQNLQTIASLETDIENLRVALGTDKSDLARAASTLKEDKLYLHDLDEQCKKRAIEWDQRSATRSEEIVTLKKALSLLSTKVQVTDVEANERAFYQSAEVTFLQTASRRSYRKQSLLLQRGRSGLSTQARKERALATLNAQALRLKSSTLQSLAARTMKDPFSSVKELIQKLIERLLAESEGEAAKKGFCDTQIKKAEQDRDYRLEDVQSLNTEIGQLEAKEVELQYEIGELTTGSEEMNAALLEAAKIRSAEKGQNENVISLSKAGYEALLQCIDLLKTFYTKAERSFLQVSPVDQDTAGAGFEGPYKGQKVGIHAIISLLEVIKSDYERTLKSTSEEEAEAHEDFVKFERRSKADLSGKQVKKTLDKQDLNAARFAIDSKMTDLKSKMSLVDQAVMELSRLNAMCADSGMSYADRVARRDAEIAALKTAVCQLDSEDVEADCDGEGGATT